MLHGGARQPFSLISFEDANIGSTAVMGIGENAQQELPNSDVNTQDQQHELQLQDIPQEGSSSIFSLEDAAGGTSRSMFYLMNRRFEQTHQR